MKKRTLPVKKVSVMFAAACVAAVVMISTGISVLADSAIKSKGKLVFDREEISVYASDIDYLQSEMDALFQELP